MSPGEISVCLMTRQLLRGLLQLPRVEFFLQGMPNLHLRKGTDSTPKKWLLWSLAWWTSLSGWLQKLEWRVTNENTDDSKSKLIVTKAEPFEFSAHHTAASLKNFLPSARVHCLFDLLESKRGCFFFFFHEYPRFREPLPSHVWFYEKQLGRT